jgi:hypothetical protein
MRISLATIGQNYLTRLSVTRVGLIYNKEGRQSCETGPLSFWSFFCGASLKGLQNSVSVGLMNNEDHGPVPILGIGWTPLIKGRAAMLCTSMVGVTKGRDTPH